MAAPKSVQANSEDPSIAAVTASQTGRLGTAVLGTADGVGVLGRSTGTEGFSGVRGESEGGPGVSGSSVNSVGVDAQAHDGPAAVRGVSTGNAPGILGSSPHVGVHGRSTGTEGFSGVRGESDGGPGLSGASMHSVGLDAVTGDGPAAVRAVHQRGGLAGLFDGSVHVTKNLVVDGDITLAGGDLAEQFGLEGEIDADPGTVVVLAGDDLVRVSASPYDHRVAGVVSGANTYRPAIVLDRREHGRRCALALTGKVWCKVDADLGAIELGDMLTTSTTPGHAMRADDPARAFGSVLGKALEAMPVGRGLIPVLVTLH